MPNHTKDTVLHLRLRNLAQVALAGGRLLSATALFFSLSCCVVFAQAATPVPARSAGYETVQQRLAQGWNTWDNHSVMTQVLLPEGLAVHVGIKHQTTMYGEAFLNSALIGRQGAQEERVIPGPHAYDGLYTDMKLLWRDHQIRVQSAHQDDDLVMLVTPLTLPAAGHQPAVVVFSVGMLWNRDGSVAKSAATAPNGLIEAVFSRQTMPKHTIRFYLSGTDTTEVNVPISGPYFSADLRTPVGLSTGTPRTIADIKTALDQAEQSYRRSVAGFGKEAPIADAIQSVLGWDTLYEPEKNRVLSPVSRLWSLNWGGYVLFDWDTFFAATLAAAGDRDLAYANAIEICREAAAAGFVPNAARSGNWKSEDRSEPPVGAITIAALYKQFGDRWLLEDTFAPLLRWNRWWAEHRDRQGYLVWGSDEQNAPRNLDDSSPGTHQGAEYESGLDNSPMYDDAAYDKQSHHILMADVGLMGMYIADCDALAGIAETLGKTAEAGELHQRSLTYRSSLATLWDPATGIFLNKDLRSGAFSHRLSPTNFYPLLARAATPEQATRMVNEHLLNPGEFWGEWVIPSIARNDPAYKDQNYWRGRIWGPMNYLVYLGLRQYPEQPMADAAQQLAAKSAQLFLKDWLANGHVHENYNASSGEGDDVRDSDRFYHWGALLGLMDLEQQKATRSR